jgi:predicted HAD superfamily Cof-like phosphohydrolase
MNEFLEKVKCFHETFSAPVLDTPQIPSKDRSELRVSLLQEELDELKLAIENNDLVEVLDAFCDLSYVLHGAVLEFGLKDKFDAAFNEVQRSNMSKACNTQKEAIETLLHYKNKDNTEGTYREVNGKWIVYRSPDDKILKSVNYSPANIKDILEQNRINFWSFRKIFKIVLSSTRLRYHSLMRCFRKKF